MSERSREAHAAIVRRYLDVDPAPCVGGAGEGGAVSPAASTIPPGQTLQLSAAITDGSGNPVAGQVVWATLNPAVATASQGGLVTGVAPGQAQIVATFAGVGGYTSVTVSAATQLAFVQQPQSTASGSLLPAVQVAVRDGLGNVVTGATDPVTLAITAGTGTAGAVLSGTLTANAVAGIAAFSDLSVDRGGTGYTLTATSAGLAPATSAAFDVTAARPPSHPGADGAADTRRERVAAPAQTGEVTGYRRERPKKATTSRMLSAQAAGSPPVVAPRPPGALALTRVAT